MKTMLGIAQSWIGYLEKRDGNAAYLYEKTANAGANNYTCFWDMLDKSMQTQPWCQCFINAIFTQAYGTTTAKKLLCTKGAWSYYTPTAAGYFKNQGRWHTTPAIGDIIYFKNSQRIHHVGIVVDVTDSEVVTIEGNTSSEAAVVANGGGVFRKRYSKTNAKIAGYGRPDYSLVDADKYEVGWHSDAHGWWYADTTRSYPQNKWMVINNCKYYFDDKGYAVKGVQTIDGKRYYFEDTAGAAKECAMMITDKDGSFIVWTD